METLSTPLQQPMYTTYTQLMANASSLAKAQPALLFLWLISLTFIVVSTTLFIFILTSRLYKTRVATRNKRLKKKFELLFTAYLFMEDTAYTNKVVHHFKSRYLTKPAHRKLLMEELLRFHKDMAGAIHDMLRNLYIECGLREDSYKKLESRYPHVKARGIEELRQMDIREALPRIVVYRNHPNLLVRSQVQLSMISLASENQFAFFHETEQLLPEWQLLNLFEMVQTLDKASLPDFCTWLGSGNVNVVRFSIQMVKLLNQAAAIPALEQLLLHPNPVIQADAIAVLAELQHAEVVTLLQEMYPSQVKEVQLSIIEALQQLGGPEQGIFLRNQFPLSNNYELNMALSRACYALLGTFPEDDKQRPYSLAPYALHIKDLSA